MVADPGKDAEHAVHEYLLSASIVVLGCSLTMLDGVLGDEAPDIGANEALKSLDGVYDGKVSPTFARKDMIALKKAIIALPASEDIKKISLGHIEHIIELLDSF
ncbi:MAG: hypothetical protein K6G80_10180 [Treponema sp.]|nr:hypothetical protein [Treponema sp.]